MYGAHIYFSFLSRWNSSILRNSSGKLHIDLDGRAFASCFTVILFHDLYSMVLLHTVLLFMGFKMSAVLIHVRCSYLFLISVTTE